MENPTTGYYLNNYNDVIFTSLEDTGSVFQESSDNLNKSLLRRNSLTSIYFNIKIV